MSEALQTWRRMCGTADLADGEARCVRIGEQRIAVFRLGEDFHALADRCPHGDASLAEGWIENGEVECPLHQARFCIASGRVQCGPAREDVQRFDVKLEDDEVMVRMAEATIPDMQ